jgi:hypothetical protein
MLTCHDNILYRPLFPVAKTNPAKGCCKRSASSRGTHFTPPQWGPPGRPYGISFDRPKIFMRSLRVDINPVDGLFILG